MFRCYVRGLINSFVYSIFFMNKICIRVEWFVFVVIRVILICLSFVEYDDWVLGMFIGVEIVDKLLFLFGF